MNPIQPPHPAWQMKAFRFFTLLGWVLILIAFLVGVLVLAPTASSYLGDNAKATRDATEAGSALLGQLGILNTIPRWLEPLTFLGVASFMVGIALEFSSIPALLKNRGQLLKTCLPLIIRVYK